MKKETTENLIKVMQAFLKGEAVEQRAVISDNHASGWFTHTGNDWNTTKYEYRIKPKPQYRPFNDIEECWQEMLKHQPFGWLKDDVVQLYNIINIKTTGITVNNGISNCNYSFKNVFNLTFADGTPFGIKI